MARCWIEKTAAKTSQINSDVRLEMDALVATETWMEVLVWEQRGSCPEKGWREIIGVDPTRPGWMALWEEGELEAVTTPYQNQSKYLHTTSTLTANQLPTPSIRRLPTDSPTGALQHRRVTLGPTQRGVIPSQMQTTDPNQPHHYLRHLSS